MLKRAARSTCPGLRAVVMGASSDAESGRHGVPFGLCHWRGREELGGSCQCDRLVGGMLSVGERGEHLALKPWEKARETSQGQPRCRGRTPPGSQRRQAGS